MVRIVRWPVLALAAVMGLTLCASVAARGQDSALHAERLVDFSTGKVISLAAKVGPINVHSVEFTDRGRSASGGLSSMMRSAGVSETSTIVRSHFIVENPTADEWEASFTVEFLDKSGKVIDKAVKKSTWEGQAKPLDLDHPILQYVVPLIAQVRIKLEARLD